jgi:short-subunit dehydrogenase
MKQLGCAVVTGASSGIGYALSCEAAKLGYDIVMVAKNVDKLHQAAQKLEQSYGVETHCICCDLSGQDGVEMLQQALIPFLDSVEVFINNAGIGIGGEFVSSPIQTHQALLHTNLISLVFLSHFIARHFVIKRKGYLLNLASLAAFQPGPFYANYYASKAYVLHFTEGLAEELKPYGVRCAVLCPGTTATQFHERAGSVGTGLSKGLFGIVMEPEVIARSGIKGLFKGQIVIVPGLMNKLAAWAVRLAPRWAVRRITAGINR